jgi:anti-sigma factor RsiW
MACDAWREQLDFYADGELAPAESRALSQHMRECPDCAAAALELVQLKRSVASAGIRYVASPELRRKVSKSLSVRPRSQSPWTWAAVAAPAVLVVIVSVLVYLSGARNQARSQRALSEITDLHVAALASATPVDVLSTDRHTVKPWFEGKIPFTFNLPDLQGSDYTLIGGRVAYLEQSPGAQLIYQIRKHRISVFVFQDRSQSAEGTSSKNVMSFNVENWTQNGLRYFVVGDVGAPDIEALSKLLREAR